MKDDNYRTNNLTENASDSPVAAFSLDSRLRQNNFDLLRFVFAFVVFLVHAYVLSGAEPSRYRYSVSICPRKSQSSLFLWSAVS